MLQVQLDSKNIEMQDVTSKELNELQLQGKLEEVSEFNQISLQPQIFNIIHYHFCSCNMIEMNVGQ